MNTITSGFLLTIDPLCQYNTRCYFNVRKRLKSVLFDRAYHWPLLALLDVSYSGALQILRWLIDWLNVRSKANMSQLNLPHGNDN